MFELKIGVPYQNVGTEAVNEWRLKNKEQKMIRKLKRCGYEVSKIVAWVALRHFHTKPP